MVFRLSFLTSFGIITRLAYFGVGHVILNPERKEAKKWKQLVFIFVLTKSQKLCQGVEHTENKEKLIFKNVGACRHKLAWT
jgi:hypothetical protein